MTEDWPQPYTHTCKGHVEFPSYPCAACAFDEGIVWMCNQMLDLLQRFAV